MATVNSISQQALNYDQATIVPDPFRDSDLYFPGLREQTILKEIRLSPDYAAPFQLQECRNETSVRFVDHNSLEKKVVESSQGTIKVIIGGKMYHTVDEGTGAVDAFDNAMKKALRQEYPCIQNVHLLDYQVRLPDPSKETESQTRVTVLTRCGDKKYTTVGVSDNEYLAAVNALCDAYELCLSSMSNSAV